MRRTALHEAHNAEVEANTYEDNFGLLQPRFALSVGGGWRSAPYLRGSGTNTLVFGYQVQSADTDANGVSPLWTSDNITGSLDVITAKGTDLAAFPAFDNIGDQAGHKVDGSTVRGLFVASTKFLSTPSNGDTYLKGEHIELEMTFSEAVTVDLGGTFITLRMESGSTSLSPPGGNAWRGAHYNRRSGTNKLVFRYTVKSADLDDDGVVAINGDANYGFGGSGAIRAVSDNAKTRRAYRGFAPASGHKVDGIFAFGVRKGCTVSLTSQLDNSSSPIRKFLEERFPNTRAVTSEANAQFRKVETIRPSEPVPWGTMGTAFDYRARYYFRVTPSSQLVAWQGALSQWATTWVGEGLTGDIVRVVPDLVASFFADLYETLARMAQEGRLRDLEQQGEELLARYCIVLALFEEMGRPGVGQARISSPLMRHGAQSNTGDKMLTLVASALAGGDCIDDADALRAGGTVGVLGCVVKAPSTLGTFLRSFRWGHVRQLDRVSRRLLARAWAAGAGPGDSPLTIDLDSTICETYGLAKEGARHHGYTGARGYHPLLAIAAGTGEVLMSRLREGRANTARGAAHFLRETVGRVRYGGARGQLTVRADSGFYAHTVVAACREMDVRFSITIRQRASLRDLIEAIPEEDWTPIPYWMDGAADVAETTYTPFQTKPDAPPARLIVRRVKPTPGSQLALFARYSYHAFITDRDGETLELEADHRRHAEVENAIRDLKYGVGLNHMPSARFAANGAWLAVQVMAHNLARWTARIGLGERTVITKTLRRRVFALVGRITRSARRLTLHLPRRWPWETQFSRALARLQAIPFPA